MSEFKQMVAGSLNPVNIFDTLKFKLLFARNNPDYFYPAGIWVFCGPQGSGKTLSAVQCVQKMARAYPKAIVCTNLDVKGIENEVIQFEDYSQLEQLSNGINGIIFLLDEIHILWNSLESKEIPISEMACFCQMRKNRRVIVGTSQVYGRIAKPIREQLQYVVDCHNYFGVLQINDLIDPSSGFGNQDAQLEGDIIGHSVWFHSPRLYDSYDTLFKINKANRLNSKKKVGVYRG